jgi:hypothetical protein
MDFTRGSSSLTGCRLCPPRRVSSPRIPPKNVNKPFFGVRMVDHVQSTQLSVGEKMGWSLDDKI